MKTTINISIGGWGFKLEDDAYQLLDEYLVAIKKHFHDKEFGNEIVTDLEARISELLRLKIKDNTNTIVSINDIQELIQILGNPSEMDDAGAGNSEAGKYELKSETQPIKKKLYRDMQHAVFGGVCSGIGHYFNIDPVIIRSVLLLTVILSIITGFFSFMAVIFAYLIFWAIIPKPQTMEEFTQMLGKDASIVNIENREQISFSPKDNSIILKIIKSFFGIILALISFSLLLAIIVVVAVSSGIATFVDIPEISFLMDAFSFGSTNIAIGYLLCVLFPLMALLYWSIKLLFHHRLTKVDLFLSIVAIITWVGASCYVGAYTASYFQNIQFSARESVDIPILTSSDTIYIKIDSKTGNEINYSLGDLKNIHYSKKGKNRLLEIRPWVKIKEDSTLIDYKVIIKKQASARTYDTAKTKVNLFTPQYSITDSLLIIEPISLSDSNPWDYTRYDMEVIVPKGKKVIILNTQ